MAAHKFKSRFYRRLFYRQIVKGLEDRLFTALILTLIAVLLAWSGALIRFDNLYYDLGRYLTFKQAPRDIVIVAIDEASLNQIGRWPWSRTVHAELVTKLKAEQARVIGLDIIFSEPELNSGADLALVHAIEEADNVVLPVLLEVPFVGAPVKQSYPMAALAAQAAALGSVHVPLDIDGMARSIYLWEGLSSASIGNVMLPHFAQSILKVAGQLPSDIRELPPKINAGNKNHLLRQEPRKISFSGPPGHFQTISYASVLSGNYPTAFFKNKIILVGATAVGMGDVLPTPVSALMQPMPGVEFHANVIEAMRHSKLIVDAPLWITCAFCVILALVPLLWLPKASPLKSLFFILLYFFTLIFVVVSIPYFLNVWIPPSGAIVAVLLVYPIWSWRKLDSAQVFLELELQNLRNDLSLLGIDQTYLSQDTHEDPLQSRISKVKLTAKHVRDLHRDRSDTLAFISHDIRAPLGSAIMLLNEAEQNKYTPRITQMLVRALDMAESFLQASRAEMANVNQFQHLDFVWLVQQVLDDVYEVAAEKSVKLVETLPAQCVWVSGDFGLLQRAISNLLLNAIKYSPNNAEVQVKLTTSEHDVILTITDAGAGIPAEKIPKLFKRFSRAEGQYQAPKGSGLGLYFVDVTAKKHQGTISVVNAPSQGATFILTLPHVQLPE